MKSNIRRISATVLLVSASLLSAGFGSIADRAGIAWQAAKLSVSPRLSVIPGTSKVTLSAAEDYVTAGTYLAPTELQPSAGTVTINCVSAADPCRSISASVTLR